MFDVRSRYYNLEEAKFDRKAPFNAGLAGVTQIAYKRRRFLPQGRSLPVLAEVRVTEGERLDLLTHRLLGDPQQYWQVCDANDTMNPTALIGSASSPELPQGEQNAADQSVFDRIIRVPLPQIV